jgi:hypothetical protein
MDSTIPNKINLGEMENANPELAAAIKCKQQKIFLLTFERNQVLYQNPFCSFVHGALI